MEECLRLNPAAQIHDFDSSSAAKTMLIEVPTRDGTACSRYVLPCGLIELLQRFNGTEDTDCIIRQHLLNNGGHTAEKLRSLVNEFLLPKGILVCGNADRNSFDLPLKAKSYMYFKVTLLNAAVVRLLTALLTWLFAPKVVIAVLPVCLAAQFFFFIHILPNYRFDLNHLSGSQFIIVINLASVFGIVHELGHATALRRFGYKRATIGWGIYLALAVFFSDLSDAWKLKRAQRAIVDVGGIYFHGLSLVGLIALISYTHASLLVYCAFFIDLQIVGALNPFLRMDGYWLIADIFGIVDLRRDTLTYGKQLLERLAGVSRDGAQPEWAAGSRNKIVLSAYLLLSLFFSVYIYKILFAQIAFNILPNYPTLLYGLWTMLLRGPRSAGSFLSLILGVIWKGVVLFGFFRMMLSLLKFLWRSSLSAGHTVRQRLSQGVAS